MKSFIVLALFVAAAVAIPVDPKDAVTVVREQDNLGTGSYSYNSQTSDGKSAFEEGHLENVGTENEALTVRGQFEYTGPDGVVYSVSYTADKNGFHPQGAHLPVPV